MPRIVLVGAGSVEFTRNLLGDILTSPACATPISPSTTSTRSGSRPRSGWPAGRRARSAPTPTISAHLDRREALEGADFVVNTIQVGGARGDPARLRRAGAVRAALHDRRHGRRRRRVPRRCARSPSCSASPATWRRSARTPGCSTTRTHSRSSSGRCPRRRASGSSGCATRCSGRSTGWPGTSACRATRSTASGRAQPPRLRPPPRASRPGSLPGPARLRRGRPRPGRRSRPGRRCSGDFGFYLTESSEHHAEYNPWFIGKRDAAGDAVERFHVPIGEYLDRVARNLDEYAETKRMLDAGEPFEIERSGEYAATIAEAMTTGVPARIVGQRDERGALIPNLDARRLRGGPGPRRRARACTRSRWARCRSTSRHTSAAPSTCRA